MATKICSTEISTRNTEQCAWIVVNGNVYDITSFLSMHPGGKEIILQNAGRDVTSIMQQLDIHKHSSAAYSILKTYKIGELRNNASSKKLEFCGWNEDRVDWNKGLVLQVHKYGHDYINWVHSPVNKPLKLFETSFLEFFSKTPWYLVPLVWLPVVIYIGFTAFGNLNNINEDFSISPMLTKVYFLLLMLMGIMLWTLVEYILHRFLFHLNPSGDSPFWITLHFFLHGQHHKVPFDPGRLVFPPAAASVIALPFYLLFVTLFPIGVGQSLFAGGLLGYVIYDMTHYYLHHGQPSKDGYFHRLKHYHMQHHFADQNKGFGISSKFWDLPFGTSLNKSD